MKTNSQSDNRKSSMLLRLSWKPKSLHCSFIQCSARKMLNRAVQCKVFYILYNMIYIHCEYFTRIALYSQCVTITSSNGAWASTCADGSHPRWLFRGLQISGRQPEERAHNSSCIHANCRLSHVSRCSLSHLPRCSHVSTCTWSLNQPCQGRHRVVLPC